MRRLRPEKRNPSRSYKQLWRVVDGAVADCLEHHPEYIAQGASKRTIRNSITKRVTGSVLGYATEVAKSRSSVSEAADKRGGLIPRLRARAQKWLSRAKTRAMRVVGLRQPATYSRGEAA